MKKKKAEEKIKRLKKMAKEATAAKLALEKRVRKLERQLDAKGRLLSDLQEMLADTPPPAEAGTPPTAAPGLIGGAGIVSGRRAAWKRHSYLRDRYELHLNAGETKETARQLANEDLKQTYGAECGYTEDQLSAILS